MGTISVSLPSDGSTADVSDYNTPINTIVNEINGNLENANIKSGAAIAADKIAGGVSGMFGAWSSYTPTLTNVTIGSGGAIVGEYVQIGKTVHYSIKLTLGTSGVLTGAPTFTLPVASDSFYSYNHVLGMANAKDTSALTFYLMFVVWNSSTVVGLREAIASSTYVTHDTPSASAPFTWDAGDIVSIDGTYQAA